MPRITKKQIREEEENEYALNRNARICIGLVMQKMELEINNEGNIIRNDDECGEITAITFDGKACVSSLLPNREIDMERELPFDPYNNVKLAASLLTFYLSEYLGKEILFMGVTNKKLNEEGKLILKFADGQTIEGNIYDRDSLKYIDMVYMLEGSAPPEYTALKEIDLK